MIRHGRIGFGFPEPPVRLRVNMWVRLFLTTNAGSTGLNLQAANTVINVDLPWNPAVLEQRIARALSGFA